MEETLVVIASKFLLRELRDIVARGNAPQRILIVDAWKFDTSAVDFACVDGALRACGDAYIIEVETESEVILTRICP
jgi:hypothetical protein